MAAMPEPAIGPNPDAIAAALEMLCPAGVLLLVAIDPRRTENNVTGRTFTLPGDTPAATEWAVAQNDRGWNVYWTPNEARPLHGKAKKTDMRRARYMWADCDPAVFKFKGYDAARRNLLDELLPKLAASASFVIDSGHGLQAFWLLDEPVEVNAPERVERFERLNQRLGALYGSEGTHNVDRVMRLPGTVNYVGASKISKGYPEAPSMARLLHAHGARWTWTQIEALVGADELQAKLRVTLERHPAVRARWDGGADGLSDRSGSAMDQSMVTMLALAGWAADDIRAVLERWPHGSVGGREQGDRYWQRMFTNAAQSVAERKRPADVRLNFERKPATEPEQRPIQASTFRLRDPATIEPRDWLYKRIFIRRYVTGTFAPGAAAKTQINLLDLVTMACGFDLATREPLKRGPLAVWYVNVEDDLEEIERRIGAICLHYGITDADLGGRLHVDTDREGRYLIAEQSKEGVIVRAAVVDAILEQVKARGIDLLLVDPLVGMHAVSENSNPEMNRVISQLRRVAETGSCGVHVIHHVRKGGDGEVSAEDGRGASAIKDACRAIRTLSPMSEQEASDFGIPSEQRRFYVWANPSGKPNLAPPTAARDWYVLVDVGLGNERADRDEDRIGVPVRWTPPRPLDDVTLDDCRRAWARIQSADPITECRLDIQSKGWVGRIVGDCIGVDITDPVGRSKVKGIVNGWVRDAVLEKFNVVDPASRHTRPCLRLGPAAKLA
jgi:hypothetical protein